MAGVFRFTGRNNDVDLNNILTDSWYFVGTDNANKPDGTAHELAFVHTKKIGSYGSNYYMQWYYGWSTGSNYIRKNLGGTWQTWEKI